MMKVPLSSGVFCYVHKGKLSSYKIFLKPERWLVLGELESASLPVMDGGEGTRTYIFNHVFQNRNCFKFCFLYRNSCAVVNNSAG